MIIPVKDVWGFDTDTMQVVQNLPGPPATPKPTLEEVELLTGYKTTKWTKYLPWMLIGGIALFVLFGRKGK